MHSVTAMFDPAAAQSRESVRRVRRAGLLISLVYWTMLLAILTGLALLDGWETPSTFVGRCINTVLAVALSALIAQVVTSFRSPSFAVKVGLVLGLTLVCAIGYQLVTFHVMQVMGANDRPLTLAVSIRMVVYWFGQFLGWSALLLASLYHHEVQDRERQLSSLREQAFGAQMRALRYQINPHFLFNTLNALAALIEEREFGTAERMVLSLSAFLRSTLALDPLQDITLAEELAIQLRYLDIERERFSDRLDVSFDVPEGLKSALLPSLILQPLVENAVKHGVGAIDGPIMVRVQVEAAEETLLVHVENTAPDASIAREGEGVGLRNVAERLQARFGQAGQLTSGRHGGLFRATVRLPLRSART